MNERSSQLFSQLVDINWELNNVDYPKTIKFALTEQYWKIKNELIDEMGIDAFNNFIEQGRRMFAPKDGYGDESPEEVENMMARVS